MNNKLICVIDRLVEDISPYSEYISKFIPEGYTLVKVNSDMSEKEVLSILKGIGGVCITNSSMVDWLDEFVLRYALENKLAIFAIGSGLQVMGKYTGESIEPILNHNNGKHYINISRNSTLYNVVKKQRIMVNSMHDDMVLFNHSWDIVGVSDDGVVEAMENSEHLFQIGVQWSPQLLLDSDVSKDLFYYFVKTSLFLKSNKLEV